MINIGKIKMNVDITIALMFQDNFSLLFKESEWRERKYPEFNFIRLNTLYILSKSDIKKRSFKLMNKR